MSAIRYIGTGREARKVSIAFSITGGKAWKEQKLIAGQTFHIPPNCTNLLVDNVPCDPGKNYEIRDGKLAPV